MLKTVEVNNIKCSGCANNIIKTLEKEGFKDVKVDLSCEPRKVTVTIKNEVQAAQFRVILRKLGYPFSDEEISFSKATAYKAKSFVSCAVGKFTIENNTSNS